MRVIGGYIWAVTAAALTLALAVVISRCIVLVFFTQNENLSVIHDVPVEFGITLIGSWIVFVFLNLIPFLISAFAVKYFHLKRLIYFIIFGIAVSIFDDFVFLKFISAIAAEFPSLPKLGPTYSAIGAMSLLFGLSGIAGGATYWFVSLREARGRLLSSVSLLLDSST